MSQYKNILDIRNNTKIYKFQNKMSAVDVTPMLNSYREKKYENKGKTSTEYLYSGRICFSVFFKVYEQAYLTKSEAKLMFETVRNGTFSTMYPNGFSKLGGGSKDGKTFSTALKIKLKKLGDRPKIDILIETRAGNRDARGAIVPEGKVISSANSMLDPINFLEMAIEVTDFLRAAEVKGMLQDTPLNTLTSIEFQPVPEIGQKNSNTNYNQTQQAPVQEVPVKTGFSKDELENMNRLDLIALHKDVNFEYNRRVKLAEEAKKKQNNPAS